MQYFTSDTHFGHNNIIKYCNRPFRDFHEQDEEILRRFNERLKPGDILYHLGDVSWSSCNFGAIFDRLNTKEIHLVYGNHDKLKVTRHPNIRSYSDIKNITIEGTMVVMCHYSMQTWRGKGRGAFMLYGHSHNTLPGIGRSMDVGVDTHDFYPWSWDEIKERLSKIDYKVYE